MADDKFTVRQLFTRCDADRHGSLEQARIAAMLTKPHVLPPAGQRANQELPKNFQSIGSRGISILVGKLLLAMYPPGVPWFVLVPAAHIRNDPNVDPSIVQQTQQDLFLYGSTLMAQLESSEVNPDTDMRRRVIGFRSHKARTIEQILITGDALERLHDDFRMQLFRRHEYVSKRDTGGAVLFHIVQESKDMADLSPDPQRQRELYEKSGLPDDLLTQEDPTKRIKPIYTWVQWQPKTRTWVIRQEINDHVILESQEPVSPFISTPFELTGEDYGRGFIESQNLGDLRSLDELELRLLEHLGLSSKALLGIDDSANMRDDDLMQPPGSLVHGCRVVNGVVQNIGPIQFTSGRDYQMLVNGVTRKSQSLAASMLIESETTRQAERVTTVEIQRNVAELQSALGGVYTSVADENQLPLLQRVIWQWNEQNNTDLPRNEAGESLIEVRSLTGLAALSNNQDIQKLLTALQMLQQLGPEAMRRIDIGVAVDVLLRQVGLHEPGLIKSSDQIAAEDQAAAKQQLALQAGQQAIQSSGRIAEGQAAAQAQAEPQNGQGEPSQEVA